MDAKAFIEQLALDKAPSDSDRARVLMALVRYAEKTGLSELAREAQRAMPRAHPFIPPDAWLRRYQQAFEGLADPDQGVCPDDSARFGTEYWQGFTDHQRAERLARPELGDQDGERDANALNDA